MLNLTRLQRRPYFGTSTNDAMNQAGTHITALAVSQVRKQHKRVSLLESKWTKIQPTAYCDTYQTKRHRPSWQFQGHRRAPHNTPTVEHSKKGEYSVLQGCKLVGC